jgi:hypothetical protein
MAASATNTKPDTRYKALLFSIIEEKVEHGLDGVKSNGMREKAGFFEVVA